ncbi:serine/threonine protein kinase [Lujinxingia sediminis]|uniref:Serine/threonine protein kinase n=1 Tax=Lujinxingia sediminis TaxID=2480984 RepID=A0ABY0CZA4_9DELT|nr:serine/threonine-protein kinase [Lujinxingia sediminis]RVU48906.1 serine/threonine protein kinase [Lujinxingia sediminis]
MTTLSLSTPGTRLADRYELTEAIGEGGFGMVYRARQLNVDRDVAIKILPPRFASVDDVVERFRREARLASRLQHPNTITIHDYGQQDDLFFIVMELLRGRDLADHLDASSPLELQEALHIARQTLGSLQDAHDQGIVHRDLKPENIFLTQIGDDPNFVKVLDFGIAKMAQGGLEGGSEPGGRKLTMSGSTVGTPPYMSPEQAAGEEVDPQTDIYALGIILFEMLNGHPPFSDPNPVKVMRAHLFEPLPAFTNIKLRNSRMESIVRRALEKDRAHRFQNTAELLDALARPNLSERSLGFAPLAGQSDVGATHPSRATATKTRAEDAVPFEDVRRHPVEEPPPGFTRGASSSSSSIITVLEPPAPREDVIVLTRRKEHATPTATGSRQPTPEPHTAPETPGNAQPTRAPSSSPDDVWTWADDATPDASGSQLLASPYERSPRGGAGAKIALALTLIVVLVTLVILGALGRLPL